MIDLAIATGIMGFLGTAVLISVGPGATLLRTTDASRDYHASQLDSALAQLQSTRFPIKNLPNFPTQDGQQFALPICKKGITNDYGCVNMDALIERGYIGDLPQDTLEPCANFSGYEVYKVNNQAYTFATNKGKNGNGPLTKLCYLDTIAPSFLNVSVSLYAATATITWQTSEDSDDQVQYGVSGYPYKTSLNTTYQSLHSVILSGLLPFTTYHFQILSRDGAGNLGKSIDETFTTDDTTIPTFVGQPAVQLTETSATITWVTDEVSDSQINYGFGSEYGSQTELSSAKVTTHVQKIQNLTPTTTYHYQVLSRDGHGNYAKSADYNFKTLQDLTPPVIDNIVLTQIDTSSATVTWTTNELADTQAEYGTTTGYGTKVPTTPADTSPMKKSHSVTLTGLSTSVTYHYRARSADAYGNQGVSIDKTFALSDTAPPVASNITVTPITATTATINWDTDEPSVTQVAYGLDTGYSDGPSTLLAQLVTQHSQKIEGLKYYSTYHFKLLLRDAVGNETYSGDSTFQTLHNIYNVIVPTYSAIPPTPLSSSAATLKWSTYSSANEYMDISTNPHFTTLVTKSKTGASLVLDHARVGSGMTALTSYFYRLKSTDNALVLDTVTGSFATTADISAPKITNLNCWGCNNISNVFYSSGAMRATWMTDELSDSLLRKAADSALKTGMQDVSNATATTLHTVAHPSLADGTYYFAVRSTDIASPSNTSAFTPAPAKQLVVDTAAPLSQTNPPTVVTDNGTNLTLKTTSNETARVRFWYGTGAGCKNGVRGNPCTSNSGWSGYGTTQNSTFATSPGTKYYYWFEMSDRSANKANYPASQYNYTTLADTAPPTFNSIKFIGLNTTSVNMLWNTNELADTRVKYAAAPTAPNIFSPSDGPTDTPVNSNGKISGHTQTLPLSMGTTYNFNLLSSDQYGNAGKWPSSSYYSFKTENVAPVLTGLSVSRVINGNNKVDVTIAWKSDELGRPFGQYKLTSAGSWTSTGTGGWVGAGATTSVAISNLPQNNAYVFDMRTTDGQVIGGSNYLTGNVSHLSGNFSTDMTAPSITVGPTYSNVTDTGAKITWTTNEAADSTVEYGLTSAYGSSSGSTLLGTSHAIYLRDLTSNTQYHYRVKSVDTAGNGPSISADDSFTTTDTAPPVISNLSVVPFDTGATVTWDTNEAANAQVQYGPTNTYGNATTLDASYVTQHSEEVTGLNANALYHLRVLSRDPANNLATSADVPFTTTDHTPPVFTAVQASAMTDHSATISWITDEPATSQVDVSLYSDFHVMSSTTLDTALVTSHSQGLTGLSGGNTYYYRVKSKDASANLGVSTVHLFSTASDVTAPVISGIQYSINGSTLSVVVTWTTDEVSTSVVDYGLTTGYGSTVSDNSLVTSHSQTITNITPNTQYHFRVNSTDGSSNTAASTDNNFTYTDNTPPVITAGPAVAGVTATTATITWTTDEVAGSQIDYGLTTNYTDQLIDSTLTKDHSVTLSQNVGQVGQDITYHYRVKTRDAAGNTTTVSDSTFTTDGTPPIASAIQATDITQTGATFMWTTDEPATSKVNYGPDVNYGLSVTDPMLLTSHSMAIKGLTANTSYHYQIVSLDKGQNQNAVNDNTFVTKP